MNSKFIDMIKIIIIFISCTCLFYYGLRAMHLEYEQLHRYDQPDGPAVKVFSDDNKMIDRLHQFFRLD